MSIRIDSYSTSLLASISVWLMARTEWINVLDRSMIFRNYNLRMKMLIYLDKCIRILPNGRPGESNLRYTKMDRNLRRKKNKKYPRKPKTVNDIIKAYDDPEIASLETIFKTRRNFISIQLLSFRLRLWFSLHIKLSIWSNVIFRMIVHIWWTVHLASFRIVIINYW